MRTGEDVMSCDVENVLENLVDDGLQSVDCVPRYVLGIQYCIGTVGIKQW